MNSRERVDAALNHQKPDRVPVDFGGSRVTGVSAIAYANLLRHLGMDEPVRVYDLKQQLADPSLAMIDRMGGDVVQLHRLAPTTGMPFFRIDRWKEGTLSDKSPCLVPDDYQIEFRDNGDLEIVWQNRVCARRSPASLYFDILATPLKDACSVEDIDRYEFPDVWTEREEGFLRAEIERLYHGTDKALFAGLPLLNCSFLEISYTLFGYEQFMMNMYDEPEMVARWLDRLLENAKDVLDKYLAIAGPYISAIQMNDDFGTQNSLQVSPDAYREFFKPRQAEWIRFVKDRTDAKVFIHCDGAVESLLEDFIEIGIDILNPLQTSADGMEPEKIKKIYGDRLCFWGGGVETQSTLPFGTVEEIRTEVADRVKLLGEGGGYVFGTIHNIQADISPEKILAVFDTACGRT
jgi:uroporphyrinogen decarboxylase